MAEAETSQAGSVPVSLWTSMEGTEKKNWYDPAVQYWDSQEASYNGVLGGFGDVSEVDILESEQFLNKALSKGQKGLPLQPAERVAVDCGAGVGRVTAQLLIRHYDRIDLVEPSRHLLAAAKQKLEELLQSGPQKGAMGTFHCLGLQDFFPQKRYDMFWIQWALLYLTDSDAVAFLKRCGCMLTDGGFIIVKENICSRQEYVIDKEDSSLTRSHAYMLKLFAQAELKLICSAQQKNFPEELFKVQMYALQRGS